jgi:hypothetical protein
MIPDNERAMHQGIERSGLGLGSTDGNMEKGSDDRAE